MEMYLADNDTYPTEVQNVKDLDDSKWVLSVGKYTNLTSLEASFKPTGSNELNTSLVNAGQGFTLVALAKDRNSSPVTATNENVFKP